jgi:hypothetical protein
MRFLLVTLCLCFGHSLAYASPVETPDITSAKNYLKADKDKLFFNEMVRKTQLTELPQTSFNGSELSYKFREVEYKFKILGDDRFEFKGVPFTLTPGQLAELHTKLSVLLTQTQAQGFSFISKAYADPFTVGVVGTSIALMVVIDYFGKSAINKSFLAGIYAICAGETSKLSGLLYQATSNVYKKDPNFSQVSREKVGEMQSELEKQRRALVEESGCPDKKKMRYLDCSEFKATLACFDRVEHSLSEFSAQIDSSDRSQDTKSNLPTRAPAAPASGKSAAKRQ